MVHLKSTINPHPSTPSNSPPRQTETAVELATRIPILGQILNILPRFWRGRPGLVEKHVFLSFEGEATLRLLVSSIFVQLIVKLGCFVLDVAAFLLHPISEVLDDVGVTKLS